MIDYNSDAEPARVWHAKILRKQGKEAQVGIDTILSLLNPTEESPVLDALARIEAKLDVLLTILLPPAGDAAAR